MTIRKLLAGAGLAVVLAVSPVSTAFAGDKTAEQIVVEFEDMKPPAIDQSKKDDPAYRQEMQKQYMEMMAKRAELAKELWNTDPAHPKALEMMQFRWNTLARQGKTAEVSAEIDAAMAKVPADKKGDVAFVKSQITMMDRAATPEQRLAKAEEFITAYPGNQKGGDLLAMAAGGLDQQKSLEIYRRVAKDFPESHSAAQAKGKLRQLDGVGKPFEMSFTDAITGKPVSNDSLKGKVVVVDFWATWCGPCVAEMPKMKEIYAKYKDKGVEFVGISLDDHESKGGLDALKKFVKENDIQWPQYYQGNGWDSEFSKSWGINSIPAIFVVDQKGNLHSVNARGKVEQLIEELLGAAPKSDRVGG